VSLVAVEMMDEWAGGRIASTERPTYHLFSPFPPHCRERVMGFLNVKTEQVRRREIPATLQTSIAVVVAVVRFILLVCVKDYWVLVRR